jgi:hypothetical protein
MFFTFYRFAFKMVGTRRVEFPGEIAAGSSERAMAERGGQFGVRMM